MDEWVAIYQYLNPDKFVEPATDYFGTFTSDVLSPVDENTSLTPFWADDKRQKMLTSKDVRNYQDCG